MRIGHQAPPFFVNVRTDAKLPRRSRADAKHSLSSSAAGTFEAAGWAVTALGLSRDRSRLQVPGFGHLTAHV